MEIVGIDVGGTFTDFVWVENGQLEVLKVPTTPVNQSEAIAAGIDQATISELARVVHGTTVATNALLERRGAKAALVTTKGFADVLAIGRQNRPELYKLSQEREPHLISKALRFELNERVDATGKVLIPLDPVDLEPLVAALEAEAVESVAVVFLFSFLNPVHEQLVASVLKERLPGVTVSVSSDLLPEYREYERTATVAINAYVQPLVAKYFERLEDALGGRPIHVMQSNGGVLSLEHASEQAARLVLSGPAGGVVGALETAKIGLETDAPHIITFDMGGTSTDVALCPGILPRTTDTQIAGMPLRFPSMNIHTVGAGGGSIARLDAGGVLKVGPESAGAIPGPACYGRGGTEATVTDANVLLGRIPVNAFGASGLALDKDAAYHVMDRLGKGAGMSAYQAAAGVVRVANAVMERALRRISIEQGYDPRKYTLVPFGGAGSLHACALAELLGIERIFIPRHPGVLSAVGLVLANAMFEVSRAILHPIKALIEQPSILESVVHEMADAVRDALEPSNAAIHMRAWLDVRYARQSYELEIPFELPVKTEHIEKVVGDFHSEHARRFGYNMKENEVDVVTVRLQGEQSGMYSDLTVERRSVLDANKTKAPGYVEVWDETRELHKVPCITRESLSPGEELYGPAVVVQYDTTIWVSEQWRVSTDVHQGILLWRIGDTPLVHR